MLLRLRSHLEPLRDPNRAEIQTSYLLRKFPFLGIRTPILRKALKEFFPTIESQNWKNEARELWFQEERELHYAGIEWTLRHKKSWNREDFSFFEEMIQTNSWWDTVDTIAPHLVGPLVLRYPPLLSQVDRWIESDNFWLQRAAILFQLRYKEKTDFSRLCDTCDTLSRHKEFFIRKAIGWALREYAKTHPEKVRQYLQKATLSPLSFREASKNLHNLLSPKKKID